MEHNQNPLTLEQLRQMDGQPVWIEDVGCFGLVSVADIGAFKGVPYVRFCKSVDSFKHNVEYRGLKLYACKPIDFDKWEPCELCIRFGETDPCYKDMCFKINAPNCGYACGKFLKWKPAQARLQDSKFCPECGRPLTQDARALLEKRIMEG